MTGIVPISLAEFLEELGMELRSTIGASNPLFAVQALCTPQMHRYNCIIIGFIINQYHCGSYNAALIAVAEGDSGVRPMNKTVRSELCLLSWKLILSHSTATGKKRATDRPLTIEFVNFSWHLFI